MLIAIFSQGLLSTLQRFRPLVFPVSAAPCQLPAVTATISAIDQVTSIKASTPTYSERSINALAVTTQRLWATANQV